MEGTLIGELGAQRGDLWFAYSSEALELNGLGAPLLSVSMPTRTRRFTGAAPYTYFNGLLPEGDARNMIAYDLKVSAGDPLEMLSAIGRDCAGALVILPNGAQPAEDVVPEPIGVSDIADRLRRLGTFPLGVDGKVRVSLAGMQRKLLLSRAEGGWGLPVDGAPSTHILKPPHPDTRFPHMVANEAFCMRVAHHLGLSVAPVEIGEFEDIPVLIVERYDRSAPASHRRVRRLHQEDFCQALGIDGTLLGKYEESGGPSLVQCATILTDWAREPAQLERLLEATTFNVLIGNGDAHGKNLSLLHGDAGALRLAPTYDVFSTLVYPDASTTPGMFVNDVRDIAAISRNDLIAEAEKWGISYDTAAARIESILRGTEDALAQAAGEISCPEQFVDALIERAKALVA